jgi:hypothetical protein
MAVGWSPDGLNGDSTRNLFITKTQVSKVFAELLVKFCERAVIPNDLIHQFRTILVRNLTGEPRFRVGFRERSVVNQSR